MVVVWWSEAPSSPSDNPKGGFLAISWHLEVQSHLSYATALVKHTSKNQQAKQKIQAYTGKSSNVLNLNNSAMKSGPKFLYHKCLIAILAIHAVLWKVPRYSFIIWNVSMTNMRIGTLPGKIFFRALCVRWAVTVKMLIKADYPIKSNISGS